jgi:hypothetical protein
MSAPTPELWQFPDEDERILREAEAMRGLTPRDRFLRMLNVIRLASSIRESNPPTEAVRQIRMRDEEQWRDAFRKLYEQHGCYRDSAAGAD